MKAGGSGDVSSDVACAVRREVVIAAGDAHVWWAKPEAIDQQLGARLSVLSADERARIARFRFAQDSDAYGAAHLLLRAALTWCAPGVQPSEWDLTSSRLERPEVVAPNLCPRLRFNISHTRGLVACLVTRELDCGIDVEVQRRVEDLEGLAAKVLSPTEMSDLMASPEALRPTRFFRYWTLKEAYVKARGQGLSLPLEAVSFGLSGGDIAVTFSQPLNDHSADWQFEQWAPTEQHILAVALRSGQTTAARVVRHLEFPTWDN